MKKAVSILLVSLILVFAFQTNAEEKEESVISYNTAVKMMKENNNAVKKAKVSERQAFFQYNNTVQSTRGRNTENVKVQTPFGEMTFKLPANAQMFMSLNKEFMPKQMKFAWDMSVQSGNITETALSLGLRDLYLGFLKSDWDYKIGLKKLGLAEKKFNVNKLKLERGLISKLDFDEAEYQYIKAQKDLNALKRTRENMQRSFNSFIGVPLDTEYDNVLYEDMSVRNKIEPLEYYVESALEERLEISSIEAQMDLIKLSMEISERNRANEMYTDIRKSYESSARDLESLKAKLEKAKFDVENNIKTAYIEMKKESFNVQNMAKTLEMQKRSYEKIKKQYDQGLIPGIILEEMEIGLEELQSGFNLVVYNYNTKVMKLKEAAGLGPAY